MDLQATSNKHSPASPAVATEILICLDQIRHLHRITVTVALNAAETFAGREFAGATPIRIAYDGKRWLTTPIAAKLDESACASGSPVGAVEIAGPLAG